MIGSGLFLSDYEFRGILPSGVSGDNPGTWLTLGLAAASQESTKTF